MEGIKIKLLPNKFLKEDNTFDLKSALLLSGKIGGMCYLQGDFASIENEDEKEDMLEELIDRFGDTPRKVQQLLEIALLKALAHSVYVTSVEQKGEKIRFVMYEKAAVHVERIPSLVESYKGDLEFKIDANPYFVYAKKGKNKNEKEDDVLEIVKNILNSIKTLID